MLIPASSASLFAPAGTSSQVRAAFSTLDRSQQRLLEALLFDGQSCARLAASIGSSATHVRARAGAALLALHDALAGRDGERSGGEITDAPGTTRETAGDRGGAVAAMLVLRALDALDPDETALIDTMLLHQPTLQRIYDDYCELVGSLCTLVPRIAPAAGVLGRLALAIDDADAN